MTKELWINLPVSDLEKSKAFFTQMGFSFSDGRGNSEVSAPMMIGSKKIVVMLFEASVFKKFTSHPLPDTSKTCQVLFSFDADSSQEVDALAAKVEPAGGLLFSPPSLTDGWMYGCGFADPDGHRWNMIYMDMSKLPGHN